MSEATEKQIKECVRAMREEGVIGGEATISGFAGKILELGLRVYLNQQNSEDEDVLDVERLILREAIITRHMLEANFRTLLKLPDIRKELPISPDDMVRVVHSKAQKELAELYNDEE
jgi:hypothetical protein